MTTWRDGMGRITIKHDTRTAARGDLVIEPVGMVGVCRAPGWLQVYGPANIRMVGVTHDDEWMRVRARKRWAQRHGPRELRDRGFGPSYNQWLDEQYG
jgi:hypothetical protein